MQKNFSTHDPFVSVGLNDHLSKLFHELLECVQQAAVGYHQIIAGITLQLLGLIHSTYGNTTASYSSAQQLVEKAKFLFREHIQDPVKLEDILKNLPVSYSKLRKDFKQLTGTSPNQYMLNLRLDKAKELLANTGLSISEVAYQTGFESVSYLSKMFSKKVKLSPRAYRQQFISNYPIDI